jgi:tRNA U34 5-methylaminomethyl-2-thiouridine-forming methyltransferase MnmC
MIVTSHLAIRQPPLHESPWGYVSWGAMNDQTARIEWHESGVPIAARFQDPYFSLGDGLAETRYVFLEGNQIAQRAHSGFKIAELGFGTGLNLLATVAALRDHQGPVFFTSFEAFPMPVADMARALAAFPELDASALLAALGAGALAFSLGCVQVQVILGDARETLPAWPHKADAWYLDGFSPAKNPELWSPELMAQVAAHTVPSGTFATYTAAGHVRRALSDAGFAVTRAPGYGRKRHMTFGTKP